MKTMKWAVSFLIAISVFTFPVMALDRDWHDASCDEAPYFYRHGDGRHMEMKFFEDGFKVFPGGNIDRVNYTFMPLTLNIMGLSMSVIPETSNSVNDKTLKGQSIGFAMGGKLSFSQLIETDPDTDTQNEYLVISLGFGF